MKRGMLAKILFTLAIPVIIVFIAAQGFILTMIQNPIKNMSKAQIESLTIAASYQISEYFSKYIETVKQMGANAEYDNFFMEVKPGTKVKELSQFPQLMDSLTRVGNSGTSIDTAWIADVDSSILVQSNGVVTETGWEIKERPFYQQIISIKDIILTEPYQDALTKKWIISIINPIYHKTNHMLIGVDCLDIEISELDSIMAEYKLGKNGYFTLVSKDGLIINHPKEEYINTNIADTKLSQNMILNIKEQNTELIEFTDDKETYLGCSRSIGNTGWSVISSLPKSEYLQTYHLVTNSTMYIFLICAVILILAILFLAKSITKPIKKLAYIAKSIAEGNMELKSIPTTNDEIGMVADALNKTIIRLREYMDYIKEISETLNKIAQGSLNYTLNYDYAGEFKEIKTALLNISDSLHHTVSRINLTSEDVAATSQAVADGAKTLAVGADGQKSSIDTISSTIIDMQTKIQENKKHAITACQDIKTLGKNIETSSKQMNRMLDAMEEIKSSSYEIQTTVDKIQDISKQTNMLSLNAAIEAARAGEAGRGFSVVANTVGKLAEDSTKTAKTTEQLVTKAIQSVDSGTAIAKEANEILNQIVEETRQVVAIIEEMELASEKEAEAANQVVKEMDDISSIIYDNITEVSKSNETADKLKNQAQLLKELLHKFKL